MIYKIRYKNVKYNYKITNRYRHFKILFDYEYDYDSNNFHKMLNKSLRSYSVTLF
jgi:hypothetical protein